MAGNFAKFGVDLGAKNMQKDETPIYLAAAHGGSVSCQTLSKPERR